MSSPPPPPTGISAPGPPARPPAAFEITLGFLRLGAVLPLFFGFLTVGSLRQEDPRGDATITGKSLRNARYSIEIDDDRGYTGITSSWLLYVIAQKGDHLYLGSCHQTLRRDGKLLAVDIRKETRFPLICLLVLLFPSLAFLPATRMPHLLMLSISIVEIFLYLFPLVAAFYGTMG